MTEASITFRDDSGQPVDLVQEVRRLRATTALLTRLTMVRTGSLNIDALPRLPLSYFDSVFTTDGSGWNSNSQHGNLTEHYETGIKARLPTNISTAADQVEFIDALRLIIASQRFGTYPPPTVRDLIKSVIERNSNGVDPVSKLGLLEVLLPSASAERVT